MSLVYVEEKFEEHKENIVKDHIMATLCYP